MSYCEGESVIVVKLKKEGTVLAVLGENRFKIGIGALSIACSANELEKSTKKPPSKTHKNVKPYGLSERLKIPGKEFKKLAAVDLHGLTAVDAISKLEQAINSALLAGHDLIDVVHGIGEGVLKRTVHKHLGELSVVKNFKIDPQNPGVTKVYF